MIFASGSMTRAISLATVFTCCRDIVGPPVTWREADPEGEGEGDGDGDGGREVGVEGGGLRWTEKTTRRAFSIGNSRSGEEMAAIAWRRRLDGAHANFRVGVQRGCWGSAWGALRCGDETGGRLRSGTAVRP